MDILVVSAELAPFAAETAAADAVAGLSKALRQLGHDVTLAMPKMPGFEAQGLLLARRLTPLSLPEGGEITLYDGQLASGIKLVLFEAPLLFERKGVYGENGEDYPDNARRFATLSRAVAALIAQLAAQGKAFDVVHLHDWPAALVPVALRGMPGATPPCVLTLHDGRRQGEVSFADLASAGFTDLGLEDSFRVGSGVNVLAGSVALCSAVTTVSPRYAEELLDESLAGALGRALRGLSKPLVGIGTGVDYAIYNPATDASLDSRYDAEERANKGTCKTAVLRDLGLELVDRRPLLVLLTGRKPPEPRHWIESALVSILRNGVSLIVAGQLDSFRSKLEDLVARYADSLSFVDAPSDATERRLLAAADIALLSDFKDPAADLAKRAQRYGAVPVAHASGGAIDAIVDCDSALETGTGFLYENPTSKDLAGAADRAVAAYAAPAFPQLVRRVMRLDVGWDWPSRRTLQVYREALLAKVPSA
jgi:starch synthase